MSADPGFTLGNHAAKIESLEEEVKGMRRDLSEIKTILAETKGGLRMLIGVGTISGAIGAMIVKALAWMKGAP